MKTRSMESGEERDRRQRQNLQENSNQGSRYLRDVVSSGSCKTTGDHPQLATSNTLVSLIPLLAPGWKSYLPLNRCIQRYILATETMTTRILPATEMTRALPLERLQKDSIRLLVSLWQFSLKERMEMVSTRYLSQMSKFSSPFFLASL